MLPAITLDIWTIVAAVLNLLVMTLILKKFLFEKVKEVINNRETEVKEIYSNAQKAENLANKLKNQYDESLKNAKNEALNIVNQATINAKTRSDKIVEEATVEASNIKNNALNSIELEKKKALIDIKAEISDLVIGATEKVLEKELDDKSHIKLINDFIKEV